jgi:hypothetical protein
MVRDAPRRISRRPLFIERFHEVRDGQRCDPAQD